MKNLYFNIQYNTQWGEHLELYYSVDGRAAQCQRLTTADGHTWQTVLQLRDDARHIRHIYKCVSEDGRTLRIERNSWRMFYFNHRTHLVFADAWAEQSLDSLYQRTAFEKCIMQPRGADQLYMEHLTSNCFLLLHALPPMEGFQWGIVGQSESLGAWDISRAVPLRRTGTYEWAVCLNKSDFENGLDYKYVLMDRHDPSNRIWEDGANRRLWSQTIPDAASVVRQDELPRIYQAPWKGVGCVIPVFSLRSKGSFGIGDFGDLQTFIRWAADTGLKAIQLLPINDTTREGSWHDSYPYSGISVFALHPIYLDAREWKKSKAFAQYEAQARELNELPALDYEQTYRLKADFTRALYQEIGDKTVRSAAFRQFVEDNAFWLKDYARFCANRDLYHTANFRDWPKPESETEPSPDSDMGKSVIYYEFVQYLLHHQMLSVHVKARQLGVILKGDIPIGICPDSASAWQSPQLFHFNGQAGAPPDDFAVHGQNWGFPTYNWEEMAKDGYQWWKQRLKHMELYFDAYRIDHVLGFFRIWEIPSEQVYGLLGRFRPALPYTVHEIQQFGFADSVEQYTRPYLSPEHMNDLCDRFGVQTVLRYVEPGDGGYRLKAEYDSQHKVLQQVPEGQLQQVLMDLVAEVLFIPDPDQPQHYHPRICAQQTRVFQTLTPSDRDAFNRLYNHFFYVRHNDFWAEEALKKLPVITRSNDSLSDKPVLYPLDHNGMLACAEDLGMVPDSVKGVLDRLQILSLEIQRMPKEYGVRFGRLEHNPYRSVATIATHDMPPLRLWWTENREQTQAYWTEALHHEGEAPAEASPEICEEIVARHIQSPSMLCLLAFQDLLAISPVLRNPHPEWEQINVPANPHHYWRYRMHLFLEDLIQATDFNEKLRGLIQCR